MLMHGTMTFLLKRHVRANDSNFATKGIVKWSSASLD